jgi:hypothetical protein
MNLQRVRKKRHKTREQKEKKRGGRLTNVVQWNQIQNE